MKRKIIQQFINWKVSENHKPLIVKGARQIGKTYAIKEFINANYENIIEINFDENETYKSIFDGDLDSTSILLQMSLLIPNYKMIEGKTVIFLDEIQNCPRARTALKFLSKDSRFDVIASGSLLGINYKDVPSFPVGYVEEIKMHSMDFEEFLWALNIDENTIQFIKSHFENLTPLPEAMHKKMMELFKQYIVIGGMPEVVKKFVESKDFSVVLKIQRDIINGYKDDIAKYAKESEKSKARECFNSIPKHLAKDYKKFRYSLIEKKGTSSKFAGSLQWLYDAGIINFCYNLSNLEFPLEGNAKSDCFKVYMSDTGLLISMLEDGSQADIIMGNLQIYKGAVFENIIADIFSKNERKLYYFEKDSKIELDFLIRYKNQLTVVEVKSSENTKSKSMKSAFENWGITQGIKLSTKNISYNAEKNIFNFPLYMAMWI